MKIHKVTYPPAALSAFPPERLSAFLLFCIGVQVLWSGVSELLTLQAQSVP